MKLDGHYSEFPSSLSPYVFGRVATCYSSGMPTNVLGTELISCCRDPLTGFYRDGFCRTGPEDVGMHTVCVIATRDFLDFSVLDGNDLVTPRLEWGFPGLE